VVSGEHKHVARHSGHGLPPSELRTRLLPPPPDGLWDNEYPLRFSHMSASVVCGKAWTQAEMSLTGALVKHRKDMNLNVMTCESHKLFE